MASIAIVLVHNKGDKGNFNQIETLKPYIQKITEQNVDSEGNTYETYHYEISDLPGYEVKFYQIVPFGVTEPTNFYDIDSHNVIYRKGDEDKTGDHPRFFNWGLKRATDYGAEAVIHIDDHKNLDFKSILSNLNQVADKQTSVEYVEEPAVKISSLKLLTEVGQLDEAKPISEAVDDLKVSIADAGFEAVSVEPMGIDPVEEVKNE